ncbi:hypothetical protein ACWC9H_24405 [Streptomyces sp. NPDC001251]
MTTTGPSERHLDRVMPSSTRGIRDLNLRGASPGRRTAGGFAVGERESSGQGQQE